MTYIATLAKNGYTVQFHYEPNNSGMRDIGLVLTVIDSEGVKVAREEQKQRSVEGMLLSVCRNLGIVPKVTDDPDLKIVEQEQYGGKQLEFTHPSYGMAVFHRFQGGSSKFYGSPIDCRGGIELTISEGRMIQSELSDDNYFAGKTLAQIRMTEHQFAQLITQMNMGSGVPVTIAYINNTDRKYVPFPTKHDRLKKELEKKLNQKTTTIYEFVEKYGAQLQGTGGLSASEKREIFTALVNALQGIETTPLWIMKMWEEYTQDIMSHMKTEIRTWIRDLPDDDKDKIKPCLPLLLALEANTDENASQLEANNGSNL